MAKKSHIYPKQLYIGVDCGGQPKSPPLIAVATRWSRRERENKWIVQVTANQISKHKGTRDWEERIYAAAIFKAIDKILVPHYKNHKDFQETKNQRKIQSYLKHLFGSFHAGDKLLENPEIQFQTIWSSKYVKDAHRKHRLVSERKMEIDEKTTAIDHIMKILSYQI